MMSRTVRRLCSLLMICAMMLPFVLCAGATDGEEPEGDLPAIDVEKVKDTIHTINEREKRDLDITGDYINPDSGYRVCIVDEAEELSDKKGLTAALEPFTDEFSMIFWSCAVSRKEETEQVARWVTRMGNEYAGTYSYQEPSAALVVNYEIGKIHLFTYGTVSEKVDDETVDTILESILPEYNDGDKNAAITDCFSQVHDAVAPPTDESVRYRNPDTGYEVRIIDEVYLLSDDEEARLVEDMKPITEFGHIMFWSTDKKEMKSAEEIAKEKRASFYGRESAGILTINMGNRMITFHSDGLINRYVNASYARSVTDNASGYATEGDFYACAREVFDEVDKLLNGQKIAEPMKYTSYILIALMVAFVVVVGLAFGVFNPLAKRRQKTKLVGSGVLLAEEPKSHNRSYDLRKWVTVLIHIGYFLLEVLAHGGGGSGSSGGGSGGSSSGGSSGGGSGGSSRF